VLHRGKIIGIFVGYFLWGIPGVLIGLPLGYVVDKSLLALKKPHYAKATTHELSHLDEGYLSAAYTVMGYIAARSDSPSKDDIVAANAVFDRLQLPKIDRPQALRLFAEGAQPDFNVNDVLFKFHDIYSDKPDLLEMFIELQIYAIDQDAKISSSERPALLGVCHWLDLSKADFEGIYRCIRTDQQLRRRQRRYADGGKDKVKLANAYAVLNTSPNASDDDIKRAYRRLRSVHHPDKLLAKGLPEDMLKTAENKTHEIRLAYEAIKTVRNL